MAHQCVQVPTKPLLTLLNTARYRYQHQYKVMDDYYVLLEFRKQYLNGNLDSSIVELYKSIFGNGQAK